MCRSLGKELRVLLGVAKSIVGLLLFLVWVLFSGFSIFCIYVIRGLHLSATPRNNSETPLIRSSMGQKIFCHINGGGGINEGFLTRKCMVVFARRPKKVAVITRWLYYWGSRNAGFFFFFYWQEKKLITITCYFNYNK